MKIRCPDCHKELACEAQWCGQRAQCPYCGNKFLITEIMLEPDAGKSKWRYVLLLAAAVLCVAAGVGLDHFFLGPRIKSRSGQTAGAAASKTANADKAATENNTEASQGGEENSDDTTLSAEEGNYTYDYYDGEWLPYYRGYYYRSGSWVWCGNGRANFPPPRFRPVLRSKPAAAKPAAAKPASIKPAVSKPVATKPVASKPVATKPVATKPVASTPSASTPAPTKSAPAKPVRVKRTPAKSAPRPSGGRAPSPRGPRR